ncbi:hypothetical protein [Hymenobacter sp. B1770]|uniref:hypothetical protein n=1 Tax=Hymenobacter sp. B1770 TaxID=1718788 RepID=UPI003CF986CA
MNTLRILLPLVLLVVSACQSKEDYVAPTSTPAPPPTIVVAVNGAPGEPLTQVRVEAAAIIGPMSHLFLTGNLSDGRVLLLRYQATSSQSASSTMIPLAEISLARPYSIYTDDMEIGNSAMV